MWNTDFWREYVIILNNRRIISIFFNVLGLNIFAGEKKKKSCETWYRKYGTLIVDS